MKQLIYPIIICFIVFGNVNKTIANTIKNEILITNSFTGEKLISSKEFVQSVNRTCEDDDTCTLSKIKKVIISNFVT